MTEEQSMKRIIVSVAFTIVCAVAATPAFAQAPSKVGLTLGYPSSVGLLIPVSGSVTLRPELGFSRTSAEFEGPFVVDDSRTSWTIAAGLSALFYGKSWNDLRTYVSPRVAYNRASSGGDVAATGWAATGSFGAHYVLSDRFSVFGEVGLGWSRSTSNSSNGTTSSRSTTWSTRSALGAAIYF
jgi:hypothetical protein